MRRLRRWAAVLGLGVGRRRLSRSVMPRGSRGMVTVALAVRTVMGLAVCGVGRLGMDRRRRESCERWVAPTVASRNGRWGRLGLRRVTLR